MKTAQLLPKLDEGVFETGYPPQSSLFIVVEDVAAWTIGYIIESNSVDLESIVNSQWTRGEKETRVLVR
jgi:hypothetical protein